MVDFDVFFQRSSAVPDNRFPRKTCLSDHDESMMDSLGSFKSLLMKGNQSLNVRSASRQDGYEKRGRARDMRNPSDAYPLHYSSDMVKHENKNASSHRVSRSKPPVQPKDTHNKPGDQLGKTRAEIRRARAARNRSSARRSRLRKKAENQRDIEEATRVEKQNESLKHRVNELKEKVVGLQKMAQALGLVDVQQGSSSVVTGMQMEYPRTQRY